MRQCHSRIVENQAGIGPLLKTRKTGDKQGDSGKHLPSTQYGHKVVRVAETFDHSNERLLLQRAHDSSGYDDKTTIKSPVS